MKSLMQIALGKDWDKLPPALQAHYEFGSTVDSGQLDIDYPRPMQAVLTLLRPLGALVNRGGRQIDTVVRKSVVQDRQYWRRTITYADGKVIHFNSFWVSAKDPQQLIEFVNPLLGLQLAPYVVGDQLHYRGVQFVVRVGRWLLPIPEWLVLGHTTIVEKAVDAQHFEMDFRLIHPWFGQLFRYSGRFAATVDQE